MIFCIFYFRYFNPHQSQTNPVTIRFSKCTFIATRNYTPPASNPLNMTGRPADPASLLGRHSVDYRGTQATAIRMYEPQAQSIWVVDSGPAGMKRPLRVSAPEGVLRSHIFDKTPESKLPGRMMDQTSQNEFKPPTLRQCQAC